MSDPRHVVRIACAFDDAYAPHFATLAASLAASRGDEHIHVTLLAGPGLSDATSTALQRYLAELGIELQQLRIDQQVAADNLPASGRYSAIIWYRIFLPELLPDCDKILYLDTDTLAMQSLLPLFHQDIGDRMLGAVAESLQGEWEERCRKVGIDPQRGYFNSGVLLMNLRRMREVGFTAATISAANLNKVTEFPDQDALNLAARGRWFKLHPKWNALSYLWFTAPKSDPPYAPIETALAKYSPALVHFEGPIQVKPWYFRCMHPLRGVYREFRQQTPWPLAELEGRSFVAVLLRWLPLRWQSLVSRYKAAALKFLRH